MTLRDEELPEEIRQLGIPGIADVHVHFLPDRVMAKVWDYFDSAGPLVGREWPIRYRGSQEQRLQQLRDMGVKRFAALPYAHRPGMAQWLTQWSLEFAAEVPEAVPVGTFFPEPGVLEYTRAAHADGCDLFKIHVQVGDFDPLEPQLDPVWGLLAETATPVVIHAGSGPVPGRFTGPDPMRRLLRRHPELAAIFAHFGAPDEPEFVALATEFPNVGLDTTMVDTGFMSDTHRMPRSILPDVLDLGLDGRVFFGSDFPNIPYDFAHQVEVIEAWGLGEDWLRAVLWGNAIRLFGTMAG